MFLEKKEKKVLTCSFFLKEKVIFLKKGEQFYPNWILDEKSSIFYNVSKV